MFYITFEVQLYEEDNTSNLVIMHTSFLSVEDLWPFRRVFYMLLVTVYHTGPLLGRCGCVVYMFPASLAFSNSPDSSLLDTLNTLNRFQGWWRIILCVR